MLDLGAEGRRFEFHSDQNWKALAVHPTVNRNLAIVGGGVRRRKEIIRHRLSYEPRCEKTGLRGFRLGPTQTGLYSHRKWLEA